MAPIVTPTPTSKAENQTQTSKRARDLPTLWRYNDNFKPDWEIGEHYCIVDEENAYGNAVRVPAGQGAPK